MKRGCWIIRLQTDVNVCKRVGVIFDGLKGFF
jgi:hypothetical protein